MGPITLFDKSFLQSLSINESVWFDHFFLTNICPLFYVETLADLEKPARDGWVPEQEVSLIADRFPEMHGTPNAFHHNLCIANLMGQPVPMTGQIPMAGGHFVKVNDKTGTVFDKTPEAEAFSRWQDRKFNDVERLYARLWRATLSSLDLNEIAKKFKALGIDGKTCKNLQDAKNIAHDFVWDDKKPFDRIALAIQFLSVPQDLQHRIIERWSIANYAPLASYAPYAAHVLAVEVFFQVALAASLISTQRPSNRTDIGYLFYLPFCMAFVSSDKLHKKCAPLFLRQDQEFIWGPDLKDGLKQANVFYSQLPLESKEQGIMSFAGDPPEDNKILIQIWDRHFPNRRGSAVRKKPDIPFKDEALVKQLKEYTDAPKLSPEEIDFDTENTDSLAITRSIRKRKGTWWQLPKDLEPDNDK